MQHLHTKPPRDLTRQGSGDTGKTDEQGQRTTMTERPDLERSEGRTNLQPMREDPSNLDLTALEVQLQVDRKNLPHLIDCNVSLMQSGPAMAELFTY